MIEEISYLDFLIHDALFHVVNEIVIFIFVISIINSQGVR